MQQPKSKIIFALLAVLAIVMLTAFSVFIAERMVLMAILSFVIFIGTFGVGFTLKKKYREKGWL